MTSVQNAGARDLLQRSKPSHRVKVNDRARGTTAASGRSIVRAPHRETTARTEVGRRQCTGPTDETKTAMFQTSPSRKPSAACAAASRAIGTR